MAGARALLRAAGVAGSDFGKPIVAVANSFTEFVPGHTHLQPGGRIVSEAIQAAGGIPRAFNTIAVDDGIAMGHGGMLYSLPSRDLIADPVEYMREAHRADALRRSSKCDKLTPGRRLAAGGIPRELNAIAVDDGLAMRHGGMLYSLPSRDLRADPVEYMVEAHCADALICISNCDKITPGMLMAALRLNIPTVFVSG